MRSALDNISYDYINKEKEEVEQIVIAQISLLLATINKENFSEVEEKIQFLLDKSSIDTTVKYWKRLLVLSAPDIKEQHKLVPEENIIHKLLLNRLKELQYKNYDIINILQSEIFDNKEFKEQYSIDFKDIIEIFDKDKHKNIIEVLNPTIALEHYKEINKLKMNNHKYLLSFINQGTPETMESQLTEILTSVNGESLNDMVALLLSEILSPGSQKLQAKSENSWFTPSTIVEATQRGIALSNVLKKVLDGGVNWNRVFNLMSTKYFMNIPVNPTTASLSALLASLNSGDLIDQFFGCDWKIDFKLILTCLLHKWSTQQGCFDLLGVPNTKKVSVTIPNTKNSLLYLMSIAILDLELFLLRDELANNPMLAFYQECFFEDFSLVPEFLYLALVGNMKHFTLLTENKNVIDEIIVTLLVQVFEKAHTVFADLLTILPNKDKLLVDFGRMIIERKGDPIDSFIKILADQNKLEFFLNRIPFEEAFSLLPNSINVGWGGFESFMKIHMNTNNAGTILDVLEAQTKLSDASTALLASKAFNLQSLHFLISNLVNLPLKEIDQERFENLQYSILIAFPRIINFANGHDNAILANGDFSPISNDIEKEMQEYLQKMYSGEMAIKDIVDILRKFKESNEPREQDVFACITHAVLAECAFFKDYPLEALATTSVLFGSMILFNLFNGFVLDVALRKILNFAKEGPESKMFKFAIQAIYAFRIRLVDLPYYCKDLLQQVPGLQLQTQVYQFIFDAAKVADKPSQRIPDDSAGPIELLPIKYFIVGEWLSPVPQANPPKEVTEKMLFIVNNITMDNFNLKIPELKSILSPSNYAWFSNYLVNQRAKTEPNYHKLYANIITSLESDTLHECMIHITLRQLYVFIAAKDSRNLDKKVFKNLSSWLGIITLGLDKPIRHRNIAFRELLLDAHRENRLEIVIPFVSRVLQQVVNSKVFRPPNPWTLGLLQILLELNNKANWKLSLTFEVEVLFKELKLSMMDIEPSNYIEKPDCVDTLTGSLGSMSLEQQQTEHQRQLILMQQHQQYVLMHQQRQQRIVSTGVTNEQQQQQQPFNGENAATTNDNPFTTLLGSTAFVTHPDLKRVFQMALAKSVREILIPAIEKSSNIAVVTTIKIISKDFATESDEMKFKTAAITMVRHLAQNLARASSIESLKDGIRTTTQSLAPNLMNLLPSPIEELDAAINDNINLGLSLIEKASMDRATQEMGEQLMQAVAIRRYHKERRADQPFVNPNTNPYSLTLPEPLGLNSSGVTPQQFRIYEEFGQTLSSIDKIDTMNKLPQTQMVNAQVPVLNNLNQQPQHITQVQPQVSQVTNQGQPQSQNNVTLQTQPMNATVQSELEQNHRVLVHLMDVLVVQIKENADKNTLMELGEQNQIKNIIFQILTFIARSPQKDQLALKVAQAVVNSLFATSESSLCREVLSLLLEKLCSLSMVARKDVVWWLVYALDSRKFDVPVIRSLLEVNLIDASELDNVLVTAMKNKMDKSIDFAMNILKNTVFSNNPLLMRMDFIRTLEYLGSLQDNTVQNFLTEFNTAKVLPVAQKTEISLTEKYFLTFTEWVKLLQRVESEDTVVLVFINQMMEKGILADTDNLIEFIKAALELSVFSFKESDPTGEVFTAIDALGKLITKLLSMQEFSHCSRKEYMNIIFSVILLVFSKDHQEENTTFNERPYFRLLSNLLFEWSKIRGHKFAGIKNSEIRRELRLFDVEFYNIFASYLHSFQPFAFPGFSFAWVSLISHRMFLPIMLRLEDHAGWERLMLLVIDLLKFLDKYSKKNSVSDAISVVYKGTLRVILGISNDVPEFLIENHYELMNNIPSTYFQLKNVILSAIPKKMFVPNPYDPNLSMEKEELCQKPPSVFFDPVNDLHSLKKPVDNYLRIPSNSLLRTILNGIYRSEYDVKNGLGYDFLSIDSKKIRAIVLHVGIEAGLENERTSSSAVFNVKSSYYTLLFNLIHEGTTEVKFQVLQVMIEQLRFPNIHTYWFSYVLLNMFTAKEFEDQLTEVQEIMLRCLLERVIVNKPHAWGVSVFFTKLLRNDSVNILELQSVKGIPEIENIMKLLIKHTSNTNLENEAATEKYITANAK